MVNYSKQVLKNGLEVYCVPDNTTGLAAFNLLYKVGARDEDSEKTGFAHLFEHLMFAGSENIPAYDEVTQKMGAENNAFTSNDITNYYLTFPYTNLETAFWLESDRMLGLNINEKSLEVQRNVVIEEFKQRYLNQPYGDAWLKFRPVAYQKHPYNWSTIGKNIKHIEDATLEDVTSFFNKYYTPNNAILVVSGNVEAHNVFDLAEKWFGDIPKGIEIERNYPIEPVHNEYRKLTIEAEVPANQLTLGFKMDDRLGSGYLSADLLSNVLSLGKSSRFYQNLVLEKKLFSSVDAYILGSIDPGLLVITGQLSENINIDDAEKAVFDELEAVIETPVDNLEFEKLLNQIEAQHVFGETNCLHVAMNLAFYAMLGKPELINTELNDYNTLTANDLQREAKRIFKRSNCTSLHYMALNTTKND